MEVILAVLIGVVALFVIIRMAASGPGSKNRRPVRQKAGERDRPSPHTDQSILRSNTDWLKERWEEARRERDLGEYKLVGDWFFDKSTASQRRMLEHYDLRMYDLDLSIENLTKGEASDIIGLFLNPDEYEKQVLKFFDVSTKGISQTKARHVIAKILSNPANMDKWNERPASDMQKEFYRFFGITVPKGLTHGDAVQFIGEAESEKEGADEQSRLQDWERYCELYNRINDPEFRGTHDIKKVSLAQYRAAVNALRNEGKTLKELSGQEDQIVDKLIEATPDIQKP